MPKTYYVLETRGNSQVRHELIIPEYDEKGWYITIGSMNAFGSGKLKNATKEQRDTYRDSCGWDHKNGVLYSIKNSKDDAWFCESCQRAGIPVPPIVMTHKSIWDFYTFIGFDRKRRRYL